MSAGGTGLQKLNWIALSMILIYFLKGISYYGQKYLISYVSQKAVKDIREELYSHLQGLSLSFYNKNKTGEIISRVTNDVGKLQNSIVSSAITLVEQTLTLLGGIAYLFYLNVRLTLLLVVMIPLMTYVLAKFNRKIRRVSKNVQIRIADISDILQETLSAVRVVKSFGREDYELSRFQEKNDSNFRAKVKTAQYGAVLTPIIELIAAMAFTAILWYGGYEVFRGRMQPSALIAYFTLLLTITSPLRSMSKLSSTVQKALAAAERVFETMDIHNHLKEEVKDAEVLSSVEGHVEFVDVSFSYNKGKRF
nr:ABC transporter transmembrane domain-containing protein [Iocasia fonsfrigidae]